MPLPTANRYTRRDSVPFCCYYIVAAIDYRLAPTTKLNEILEDVSDAFHWLREQGPELFNIDPERIGVLGSSAGGYLALMSGLVVNPPPKAIVSLYGYGDIDGDWYTKPDAFYCQQDVVSEEVAFAVAGDEEISEQMPPSERFPDTANPRGR